MCSDCCVLTSLLVIWHSVLIASVLLDLQPSHFPGWWWSTSGLPWSSKTSQKKMMPEGIKQKVKDNTHRCKVNRIGITTFKVEFEATELSRTQRFSICKRYNPPESNSHEPKHTKQSNIKIHKAQLLEQDEARDIDGSTWWRASNTSEGICILQGIGNQTAPLLLVCLL